MSVDNNVPTGSSMSGKEDTVKEEVSTGSPFDRLWRIYLLSIPPLIVSGLLGVWSEGYFLFWVVLDMNLLGIAYLGVVTFLYKKGLLSGKSTGSNSEVK